MKVRLLRLLGVVSVCVPGTLTAQTSPVTDAAQSWTVSPGFKASHSDNGKAEYNVSGIACEQSSSETRTCMIVDDELTFAERVTLDRKGRKFSPFKQVEIAGAGVPLGTEPAIKCQERKKPKDLDGEAVAEAAGIFYVIGSHGCGRNSGNFRSSSFLLARVSPTDEVTLTYRVSEALRACPIISESYGKRLQALQLDDGTVLSDDGGLNIEGIAVAQERLWVGLRGPVVPNNNVKKHMAFIVSMNLDALFTKDRPLEARLHSVALGENTGVRDLASLSDGRLLVLAGPRTNAAGDYSLVLFDPSGTPAGSPMILPPRKEGGKQEGVLVVEQSGDAVDLLIIQDGPLNGDPYSVRTILPQRGASGPDNGVVCSQ